MRICKVDANNRRKAFELTVGPRKLLFPFSKLRVQPDATNRVAEVYVDAELGNEAFTYCLRDGSEDTIHLDSVLEYNEDPEYMRELLLHKLTVAANKRLS